MHRILAFVIGLVLACDAAVVVVHLLDRHTDLFATQDPTNAGGSVALNDDQAFVSGNVAALRATMARSATPTLPAPLTLTAVERGEGRVTIEEALVGGERVTVSWDGGVPLPVEGEGGIEVGLARLEISAEGLAWFLDGSPRTVLPGTYRLGAPVAVGSRGLAEPQGGVEFEADEDTVLVARGVVIRLEPQAVQLLGPGALELEGDLQVEFPTSERSAASLRSEEGPFELQVTPGDGVYQVEGLIQAHVFVE